MVNFFMNSIPNSSYNFLFSRAQIMLKAIAMIANLLCHNI